MSDKSKKRSASKKAINRPFEPEVLRRANELAPQYSLVLREESDGYGATVLELPNVFGFGETPEACLKETRELLVTMLAVMLEEGDAIPQPASEEKRSEQVNVRLTVMEKRRLEERARSSGFRGVSDYVRHVVLDARGAASSLAREKAG